MLTVLHGHNSKETAFYQNDYPFRFHLRCTRRTWIETATKGAQKGASRFMAQTTDPNAAGEVWNKPKASTYSAFMVLVRDASGRADWRGFHWFMTPEHLADFVSAGLFAQLIEAERDTAERVVNFSRGNSPHTWAEWDTLVGAIRLSRVLHKTEAEVRRYLEDRHPETLNCPSFAAAWRMVVAQDDKLYLPATVGQL
jgi:hypothetical protein